MPLIDQPKPERQDGDGLCSDCPPMGHSHRTRCLPCPRREFPTTQEARATPTRDGAEGAGECPAAGCGEVVGDTKDHRWDQGQCAQCGKWFWKSAPPKPAPDAMREAHAKIAESFKYSEATKACTNGVRTYGNDEACDKIAAAIRSAPVPPANGSRNLSGTDFLPIDEVRKVDRAISPSGTGAAEQCRKLIKQIDDLLHENRCEEAHIQLHELAHQFEVLYATPPVRGDRETIARIIEDNIYHKHDGNWDGDRADLLEAADAILSLPIQPYAKDA